jgi:hypothetical protein
MQNLSIQRQRILIDQNTQNTKQIIIFVHQSCNAIKLGNNHRNILQLKIIRILSKYQ